MSEGLHPLLVRLLRKVSASPAEQPTVGAWQGLLELVARTYVEADQDRYTLERSIEISSREMQGLYEELKRRTEKELARERELVVESGAIIRATLEAATEGIVVTDIDRRVIAVNERLATMFAISDKTIAERDHRKIVAQVVRNLGVPAPVAPRVIEMVDEMHRRNGVAHDDVTASDGRVFEWHSAPIALPEGRPVARVTFFRDVTTERNARREIEGARAAAEAASHAKTMFLANMSHELRTPLNAVIGLSDLLLLDGAEPLSARQREYIEGIAQSGRHLLALVNDVLDLAKIEAGKQQLDIADVDVGDALVEGVAALVPLAQHRGVDVAAEPCAADLCVRADRVRLRQILYNLLSNAVKFTDRGGRVRVSAQREDAVVTIAVADTGVGIDDADVGRLYRAFEQVALPSGDRPPGTGLGLALTKRLVEMHGGTIEVASRVGVGSTFTVRLPGA